MKCEKCKVVLNGIPNKLMLNKWNSIDRKYGCLKNLCNECFEGLREY